MVGGMLLALFDSGSLLEQRRLDQEAVAAAENFIG
jgi:hypothetical protein